MAGARGPKIVTGGLVLAVDAGNTKSYPGSGTTWSDTSGGGHEGTLSGMGSTHFDSADGGSFEFFGGLYTNNQIDIDIGGSLVKDFTLDFWMKSAIKGCVISVFFCFWESSVGGGRLRRGFSLFLIRI